MTRKEAQERNFKIMRLRGMWHNFNYDFGFSQKEIIAGQDLIDNLLIRMGAESEAYRMTQLRESWKKG